MDPGVATAVLKLGSWRHRHIDLAPNNTLISDIKEQFNLINIHDKENSIREKERSKMMKSLQRNITLLIKTSSKKKKKAKSNIKTGIMMSMDVDPRVVEFCKTNLEDGLNEEPKVSRVEFLKAVSSYVKVNNLNSGQNKRIIILDEQLKELFPNVTDEEPLQFTSIMKHAITWFPKKK